MFLAANPQIEKTNPTFERERERERERGERERGERESNGSMIYYFMQSCYLSTQIRTSRFQVKSLHTKVMISLAYKQYVNCQMCIVEAVFIFRS